VASGRCCQSRWIVAPMGATSWSSIVCISHDVQWLRSSRTVRAVAGVRSRLSSRRCAASKG
jgi:hypothetical protein